MAAEETGVVVGHGNVHHFHRLDPALGHKLVDELTVVQDLIFPAELGVLVAHGVEAVGADGDDLLHAVAVQYLDILLGQNLVKVLVAHTPGRVAGA